MAQLIIVHRDPTGEEILVNADRILWGESVKAQERGSYTILRMTDNQNHTVRESLSDLQALCRRSA